MPNNPNHLPKYPDTEACRPWEATMWIWGHYMLYLTIYHCAGISLLTETTRTTSMAPQTLDPMITFIITMTNTQELPLDQINTAFKFSEQYNGLCEILILVAEAQDLKIKLAWLAMKLHSVSHPRVRTRMIRYPTQSSLINLLETTINLALGERIVVTTDSPKIREEIMQMTNRNILITNSPYDTDEIHKVLAHTMHFTNLTRRLF